MKRKLDIPVGETLDKLEKKYPRLQFSAHWTKKTPSSKVTNFEILVREPRKKHYLNDSQLASASVLWGENITEVCSCVPECKDGTYKWILGSALPSWHIHTVKKRNKGQSGYVKLKCSKCLAKFIALWIPPTSSDCQLADTYIMAVLSLFVVTENFYPPWEERYKISFTNNEYEEKWEHMIDDMLYCCNDVPLEVLDMIASYFRLFYYMHNVLKLKKLVQQFITKENFFNFLIEQQQTIHCQT
jgi:hypothetical protein